MNRKQRRAAGILADVADTYRCPDCNSDSELWRDTYGIFHLDIKHGDSCPWLRARRDGE